MKKVFLIAISLFFSITFSFAQKSTISGVITDKESGDLLIGATVYVNESGAITDFDGKYEIKIPNGTYTFIYSYVGFTSQEMEVEVKGNQTINIALESSIVLGEVTVVADIAIERETPVAFSNIPTLKLAEELAAQDIPMILNSTPGAYATQSGGGDGDARITIRGFNQRNVAVMLDGIPVNDMENGWVYWSNWFGLDLVTQTMQVQRGLGASKLSVPSVGGTINILTKGIDAKKGAKIKQEIGNNGYTRTTVGLTSGRLKNGWGVSAAASYKQGDGWVLGNFTKGYFYYLRVDKQLGDHLISFSGFGAPQKHGQRPYTAEIGQVDTDYARKLGVPDEDIEALAISNKGRRFNEHWGLIDGELVNTRVNYYHKPQFSLRHSWQGSDKFYWSNVAYLSIGTGGGSAPGGSREGAQSFSGIRIDTGEYQGQYNLEEAIVRNKAISVFKPDARSEYILRSGNNDHFWYGFLSSFKYNLSETFTASGGIDGRYYRGDHYRTIYDLLGGDYFRGKGNNRIDQQNTALHVGDKITYDYSGFVRWGGVFGLLEYKKNRLSAFVNLSSAISSYSLEDFMKKKEINLQDTTLFVGWGDEVAYEGKTYTLDSPEAHNQRVDWINIPSFTFKTGASFKISKQHSAFVNTGYLSKAQGFNNIINNNRYGDKILLFDDHDNEHIIAFELGYSFKSSKFSANLNSYYTIWENKPLDSPPSVIIPPEDGSEPDEDADRISVNIPGIDAVHKGIELDFAYKPTKNLTIEGLASVADWRWDSKESGSIPITPWFNYEYNFDAKGVHVGDAAQLQFGGLVRYEPFKNFYLKLKGTYFGNNYASFQPEGLNGDDAGRDSWQIPDYTLLSFHTGYYFRFKGVGCNVRANVLNLLDATYISDARNNDRFSTPSHSDFDAKSASAHFGQGRRMTMSLQFNF